MRIYLTTFACLLFSSIVFSQQFTLKKDTLSQGQLSLAVDFVNTTDLYRDIEFSVYKLEEGDSLIMFKQTYSFDENDPGSFSSFSIQQNTYEIGVGVYELGIYYIKLIINKRDEQTETLFLN
jgi:hypothetical protein